MAAVGKRVCKLSSIPGFGASKSKVSSSSSSFHRATFDPFPVSGARHFSQWVKSNGKHLFLVDTLALVRTLEREGVHSKQAEAIIAATTEVLKDSLENVSQSFVSKGEMRKIEMMLESNRFKFKAEMQSSRGHHFSLLQHETEKLRNDIEKMRIELRKIREELSKQKAETNILINKLDGLTSKLDGVSDNMTSKLDGVSDNMTNKLDGVSDNMTSKLDGVSDNMTSKLDRGLDSLRVQLEAAKYDNMKYFMGTIVSIAIVGLAVLRLSM